MYTPSDTKRSDLIVNDRPYAGWTYLAVAFHSKSARRLDSMEIQVGIVGPQSYAEFTQKTIHNLRGFDYPQGWDNQLSNEPGLNFIYARKWRLFDTGLRDRMGFDMLGQLGGALGNIYTYANGGIETRLGWNIPADFGESLIAPASSANDPVKAEYFHLKGAERFSLYLFATADGQIGRAHV